MSRYSKHTALLVFAILAIPLLPWSTLNAAADVDGPDLVIDAPWRTTRDYLPVLFFTPDFHTVLKLNAIRLSNYNPRTQARQPIFVDGRDAEDDEFDCAISFLDPEGETRSHLSENETVDSFWHYIARVPVSCIGFGDKRGKPGEHYLRGEMDWSRPMGPSGMLTNETAYHVLRVIVTPDGFARFSPVDHYYDVHVHTVAEQTDWHGMLNANASKKAFGGPLAMLMESAYALGMVDTQLINGNWSDYRNKIITTDHNSFFSKPPYDAGTAPGHGPTSHHHTDGKHGEYRWYREHLGDTGGEEITIKGANGNPLEDIDVDVGFFDIDIDGENVLGLGSHLLSYGAPHVEGPWHGGFLRQLRSSAPNNISVSHALSQMGSSNGFGYASHPESSSIGWSNDYYEQAVGLADNFSGNPDNVGKGYNDGSPGSPILQKNQSEFVFKGLQVWNEHNDMKSRKSGVLDFDKVHQFDPYTKVTRDQQFIPNPKWRKEHDKTYETYKRLLRRGLEYSFKQDKDRIFIRKLYLSAGTDSHAAFNDDISILASHLTEFKSLVTKSPALAAADMLVDVVGANANNNAFGRLRTYTLTSQRYIRAGASIPRNCEDFPFCDSAPTAPINFPLEDYKEGNTVATDGPVGRFSTDANCRFNSDIHQLKWHDDRCVWENHDGMIGGRGKFDGGNTMLAPVGNDGVMMRYDWIGKNDYRPDSEIGDSTMTFNLVRIKSKDSDHGNNANAEVSHDFVYYPFEDNGEFLPGRASRTNTVHINEILRNPPLVAFPHKSALILEGELSRSAEQVFYDPDNAWFPREALCTDRKLKDSSNHQPTPDTLCADGKVLDPHLTKFVTNPIWIAPYKISVDAVRTCPIQPGQLKVTVEFGISMDTTLPSQTSTGGQAISPRLLEQIRVQKDAQLSPRGSAESRFETEAHSLPGTAIGNDDAYDGIRVLVKPLDQRGNSTDVQYEISGQNGQWLAVEIPREIRSKVISDAKYTTTNSMTIPCGAGWNAENPKKKQDQNFASYAIVVDQIYDMHMNYLNPIARTVTTARPSSPTDPLINVGNSNDTVFGIEETPDSGAKRCSARDAKVCGDFSATCEVAKAAGGAEKALCRWSSANTANKCQKTLGIWTTAQSRYAKNHPGVVASGSAGACLTEVKNLRNRIQ
jgi:hypothetical protein